MHKLGKYINPEAQGLLDKADVALGREIANLINHLSDEFGLFAHS
jgi:hypothetical protein